MAACNWSPQSHFRLPSISPVIHCECRRTSGVLLFAPSPINTAKCSSPLISARNTTISASSLTANGTRARAAMLTIDAASWLYCSISRDSTIIILFCRAKRSCAATSRNGKRTNSAAGINFALRNNCAAISASDPGFSAIMVKLLPFIWSFCLKARSKKISRQESGKATVATG